MKRGREMKGYNNLKREFKKIRDTPVKVIPVVCALGMTSKKLKQWLSDIGIETRIVEYRKLPSYILQGSSEMFLRERERKREKEKKGRETERDNP